MLLNGAQSKVGTEKISVPRPKPTLPHRISGASPSTYISQSAFCAAVGLNRLAVGALIYDLGRHFGSIIGHHTDQQCVELDLT